MASIVRATSSLRRKAPAKPIGGVGFERLLGVAAFHVDTGKQVGDGGRGLRGTHYQVTALAIPDERYRAFLILY
jgi:hypothetical protein